MTAHMLTTSPPEAPAGWITLVIAAVVVGVWLLGYVSRGAR